MTKKKPANSTAKPPLPKLPATFVAPKSKVTVKPDGTMTLPGYFPFYYAGIQSLWLWFRVELKLLDKMLAGTGLKAARFANGGDMGLVNLNFFNAAALYGSGQPGNPGISGFNETELNIVAYPEAVEAAVPTSYTLEGYLTGADQTKRIGNYRVWVACDSAVAVAAGVQRYFENKFLAAYDYNVPNLNNDPSVVAYQWTGYDAAEVKGKKPPSIYSATVDLQGLVSVPANMGEWIDLSFDKKTQRPVASRRAYMGMNDAYFLDQLPASPVQVQYGSSKHPMRADLQKLIGDRPAFALHRFVSPPVIIEGSPFYADL
ncbi:MAG: hypothetical protein ACOVN9_12145 [Inhella sp.]|jgi:hypothetical protein